MAYIEISQGFLIFQVRRLPSTGRPSDRRTWWNSRFCWGTSCYFLQKISDTFGFSLHNCSHLVLFSRMNLLFVVMQSNTLSCWLQEPAIPKKTLFVGRFSPQNKPKDMLVAPLISFFLSLEKFLLTDILSWQHRFLQRCWRSFLCSTYRRPHGQACGLWLCWFCFCEWCK